jgi:hypothetical protein
MEQVAVRDPVAKNMVAGTFLKPKGWKSTGGMKWYMESTHQVCFEAKVYNPDGLEQYEALPWCYCTWMTRPIFPLRPMSNYLGNQVLPPMAPKDVIEKVSLPAARKGLNPRVVGHRDMPDVAKYFAAASGSNNVRATRTRVEYRLNGQWVKEDFYLILSYTSMDIGGGNVTTLWGPVVPPFALRAAKGELDAATPKLLAIAHSGWINPKWADEVAYVQSLFMKRMNNGIVDAGKLSKQISANNDHILNLMRQSRETRWAAEDRAAKNFSDYIRGVQVYAGGGGRNVQLPGGYSHAWAGSNGTYVLSNDPNFNPNDSGNTTWTQLRAVTR